MQQRQTQNRTANTLEITEVRISVRINVEFLSSVSGSLLELGGPDWNPEEGKVVVLLLIVVSVSNPLYCQHILDGLKTGVLQIGNGPKPL